PLRCRIHASPTERAMGVAVGVAHRPELKRWGRYPETVWWLPADPDVVDAVDNRMPGQRILGMGVDRVVGDRHPPGAVRVALAARGLDRRRVRDEQVDESGHGPSGDRGVALRAGEAHEIARVLVGHDRVTRDPGLHRLPPQERDLAHPGRRDLAL